MGQQVIRNGDALHLKLPHGAVEIDGVPMDDGRGDQAGARGAEALVLPQRLPTRAAPSLVRALCVARGTPWTILCRLTGTTPFMQPVFVSTAQLAATLTPTLSAASRRDH